jgi:acetyltransferase-like isoleucine patch superfamily enzyme
VIKILTTIIEKLVELETTIANKKIVIFGSGKVGKLTLSALRILTTDADYFVDNDFSKDGTMVMGKAVKRADVLKKEKEENLFIIIASTSSIYCEEMLNQLLEMGYREGDHFCAFLKVQLNEKAREQRMIHGVKIGKYSYGAEKHCYPDTLLASVGSFCSINDHTLIGVVNHPTTLITTNPFLYHPNKYMGELIPNDLLENHRLADMNALTKNGEIVIGNDVWIGAATVILPSVKIGNGAIIAAGAIVTKDVPDYAIVAGVPAKVIKYRFSPEEISILNQVRWWDWPDEKIRSNADLLKEPKRFFQDYSRLT